MTILHKLYYEYRLTSGVAIWLPTLLLPAFAIFNWWLFSEDNPYTMPMFERITMIFELGLPLTAALAVAHLMGIEREQNFDELRHTMPEATWEILAYRIAVAIIMTLISIGITAASMAILWEPFDLWSILENVLPAVSFMVAMSIAVNTVVGNYWVSSAAVVGYWLIDFNTGGAYTRGLYLFQSYRPRPDLNATINISLLLVMALVCVTLALLWRYVERKGLLN